jgi:pyrroloquinoline quinone biosynthesis protein B
VRRAARTTALPPGTAGTTGTGSAPSFALASAALLALVFLAGLALAAPSGTAGTAPSPPAPAAAPPASATSGDRGPRVVVLGTVQDGGLPHAGCTCTRCTAARRDPSRARHVASLAIHFPASGRTWLVDATPDLRAQLDEIHTFRAHPEGRVDRAPVDGVLLTHAHIGHYLGLAFLGFEAMSTQKIPVACSPRMAAYLRANGPWSQLVRLENIALRELAIGQPFPLDEGVTATPLQVPHRDEYSDTLAFLIRGPRRSLLYVPDTDTWATWPRPLTEILEGVDVALLDATFYSLDELPGRAVARIGHPLVAQSMDLLEPLVKAGKLRVYFTHMNHSNPALEPGSPARRAIEARGFHVLAETDELPL